MTPQMISIVLSGGAGTRLWPLSRELFPKQFYDLTGSGKPLLVDTLQRLSPFGQSWIITVEALRHTTEGVLRKNDMTARVLGEPAARNTAPAVAWATKKALAQNPDAVLGIFAADAAILNLEQWGLALKAALDRASTGKVVTLGIHPTYPATGYGYMEIESSQALDAKALPQARSVKRFIEKPNYEKATELLASKKVVWNAGIFIFQAKTMAALFEKHMPDLWAQFQQLKSDDSNIAEIYPKLPAQSIDYGIMEKLTDLECVPADLGWSDVGSWEEVVKCNQGKGQSKNIEIRGGGNYYQGAAGENKMAAFVGVSDVVAVDTPDALLIIKKGEGQEVKQVVEKLKKDKPSLVKTHTFEERPWGRFDVLADVAHYKSKLITVYPGQQLSYQSHNHRAEHWIIVKGRAQVTLDDKIHELKSGDHIFIPLKSKHRMTNPYPEVMEFVEVQTGSYFGEDDIIRYSDQYGRSTPST